MFDFTTGKKFFAKSFDEMKALDRKSKFDHQPPHHKLDAIYCAAGTKDTGDLRGSITEPLIRTADLYHGGYLGGYAPTVLILRGTTKHGYAGFKFCNEELQRLRIPATSIEPVDLLPGDEEREELNTYNTYTEAKALISYCKRNRLQKIYLVDAWFYQMRASTTIISNLDRENPELWVFNKVAPPPPWYTRILHSQGILAETLEELNFSEFDRLFEYHDQGFLISCAEVLEYYKKRDRVFELS